MLDGLEAGTIPRREITATAARQILALKDERLGERLGKAWGTLRPTSVDKVVVDGEIQGAPDPGTPTRPPTPRGAGWSSTGRACLCHKLFDAGGDVGPELTGSDRGNLDYVLENVLDPGAIVGKDFTLTTIATADGRTLSGILREQTPASITVQTANERIVLARPDVEAMKPSGASMMPEGLFEGLTDAEVADLVAYLGAKGQVPTPEGGKAE